MVCGDESLGSQHVKYTSDSLMLLVALALAATGGIHRCNQTTTFQTSKGMIVTTCHTEWNFKRTVSIAARTSALSWSQPHELGFYAMPPDTDSMEWFLAAARPTLKAKNCRSRHKVTHGPESGLQPAVPLIRLLATPFLRPKPETLPAHLPQLPPQVLTPPGSIQSSAPAAASATTSGISASGSLSATPASRR